VAELHRHLRNMDARLDFTERLLDGAIPLSRPPERLPRQDAGAGDDAAPIEDVSRRE